MDFGSLPDVPMLLVLDHLEAEQLLEARAVCRRWRTLALHGSLWRRTTLGVTVVGARAARHSDPRTTALLATVLRVAPCLRELTLRDLQRGIGTLLCDTRCRIGKLVIGESLDDLNADLYVRALRNQVTLGGLQALQISLSFGNDVNEYSRALGVLSRTKCEELVVENRSSVKMSSYMSMGILPPLSEIEPSLKRLEYTGPGLDFERGGYRHLLLEFLVSAHRSTLVVLNILRFSLWHVPDGVLSGLCSLKSLTCPIFPKMADELLECRSLTDVSLELVLPIAGYSRRPYEEYLDLVEMSVASVGSCATFLCQAATLKRLRLLYESGESPQLIAVAADLLETVASVGPGLSQLESLSLGRDDAFVDDPPWELLLQALPSLPRLSELTVMEEPPLSFLSSLDPTLAPDLRMLRVMLEDCTSREFRAELRALLLRMPALHFAAMKKYGWDCAALQFDRDETCLWLEVYGDAYTSYNKLSVCLYSHDESEACGLRHETQDSNERWVWLE